MSRSRSVSLEIVPPKNSRLHPSLAVAVHAALQEQGQQMAASMKGDREEPPTPPARATAVAGAAGPGKDATPSASVPCERCIRTKKICPGIPGIRCEHCKRLKQKCSNSSGPPRNKVVTKNTKPIPEGSASHQSSTPRKEDALGDKLKRKAPSSKERMNNGNAHDSTDEEEEEDDLDDDLPPPRPAKKRRLSKGAAGHSRTQLEKAVMEAEASVKRLQTSVSKEVDKMMSILKTLNAQIKELDD